MYMEFIYVYIYGNEWEDTIIFLTKEEAIEQSIKRPNNTVQIYGRDTNTSGYIPTYNYYHNGELIQTS